MIALTEISILFMIKVGLLWAQCPKSVDNCQEFWPWFLETEQNAQTALLNCLNYDKYEPPQKPTNISLTWRQLILSNFNSESGVPKNMNIL